MHYKIAFKHKRKYYADENYLMPWKLIHSSKCLTYADENNFYDNWR